MNEREKVARIGTLIRMARAERRMSQEALAERANTNQARISMIESGQGDIKVAEMFKIAEALEKPVEYFIDQ
jgi:transcriptional regulator with XRE-family HTH domain